MRERVKMELLWFFLVYALYFMQDLCSSKHSAQHTSIHMPKEMLK